VEAIRLTATVRAALLAHARAEAPRECCGLLVGRDGTVDECVAGINVDPDPNRYRLDPAVHIATRRRLRGTARTIIGAYHSHPGSAPAPSASDRAEAYYSEFVWVIVSLAVPEAEALAAFRLRQDHVIPVLIETTG
jgi:desampylase